MPRKRRPFVREEAVRDAKLIVIATEDSKASVRYFEELMSPRYYQSSRVHVQVLGGDNTSSSPEYVLEQLTMWLRTYEINDDDEFWLVIDVDQWGQRKLSQVSAECIRQKIQLAISNPSIELWFLLHLVDPSDWDETQKQQMLDNEKVNSNRTFLEHKILEIVGRFNKGNLNTDDFLPYVIQAIEHARQIDITPTDRWPQTLGTHVYRLTKNIIDIATYKTHDEI